MVPSGSGRERSARAAVSNVRKTSAHEYGRVRARANRSVLDRHDVVAALSIVDHEDMAVSHAFERFECLIESLAR